jgi:hypothetical protein
MKTCRQTNLLSLLLIGVVIILLLVSSVMLVIPANAFRPVIHSDINDESLSFLNPDILTEINRGDQGADEIDRFEVREYHWAGCDSQGNTEKINSLYDQVVRSIDDKETMANTFGLLLHPVQDFYAHSNWVELGRDDLVDSNNDGKWPVLLPFQEYKGTIIVQVGDETKGQYYDIPDGYTLDRDGRAVYVSTSNGTYPGLISAHSTKSNNNCPDNTFTHAEINKDHPKKEGYDKARDLAEAQTTNEWCRLLNLVKLSHGEDGAQSLIDSWVEDRQEASSVCMS